MRKTLTGGPPAKQELIGHYGAEGPIEVAVRARQVVDGIDITARPFAGRGPRPATTPPAP